MIYQSPKVFDCLPLSRRNFSGAHNANLFTLAHSLTAPSVNQVKTLPWFFDCKVHYQKCIL